MKNTNEIPILDLPLLKWGFEDLAATWRIYRENLDRELSELEVLIKKLEVFRCESFEGFNKRLDMKLDLYRLKDINPDFDMSQLKSQYIVIEVYSLFQMNGFMGDCTKMGIDGVNLFLEELIKLSNAKN